MNKALQGNLYPYTDVAAPFNRTVETFRYMLSTWDDLSQRPWAEHTLLTAAFKKAGYDVYFFTNQFVPSLEDSYDLYGGRIFNYGKLSEMQFTGRNTQTHQYDEGLLAEIPSLEILSQRPTLLILHLLGQHTDYEERYPDYFKVFKTADVKSKFTDEARRTIIADYENATVYNDFVMDSLFNMFKDEDAIAVYFSDHGEDVFEWRDIHMRTDEENVPQQVAHYQYEVPFMFYMTDRFMERHSDIAEKVKSYVGRPFILTDLPNLMFHLGGIKMQDYHEERDLLSEKYDIHRKRIIRMSIDYDSLMCNFKIN
jgi:heptose-I-phosphate ethanolaminephosphotransferase